MGKISDEISRQWARGALEEWEMARQVQTKLIDDLDKSEASGTIRFGYEGGEYEIDLSEEHLREFEDFLGPYIERGRRVRDGQRHRRERSGPYRSARDLGAIRQWAREQGYEVSDRGRIANEILAKYDDTR